VPTSGDNIVIYSGGSDLVYLDVSPTINSLTLGGAINGYYSELSDNSIARTLTISQALTANPNGVLQLSGGTSLTARANSVNAGSISEYGGSSILISGNFDDQGSVGSDVSVLGTFTNEAGASSGFYGAGNHLGALVNNGKLAVAADSTLIVAGGSSVTDIPSTAGYEIAGTFTIGGDPFASLTSIEGTLNLSNQSTNLPPIGGTLTLASSAQLLPANATNLTINGNLLDNSGYVLTDGSGNDLTQMSDCFLGMLAPQQ